MSAPVSAQSPNTATMIVVVVDQTGAVVKDAKVSVANTATAAGREAVSGSDGSAIFPALSLTGTYTVVVSKAGFGESVRRSGVRLPCALRPDRRHQVVLLSVLSPTSCLARIDTGYNAIYTNQPRRSCNPMFRLSISYLFVSGLLLAAPVVVFNDFGPGNTFMPGPGITVGCGALCWNDAGHSQGWSFIPATTSSLSLLETVAFLGPSPTGTITFTIFADAGGVPGASLESFGLPLVRTPQFMSFPSSLHPVLQAGQTYWFTAFTQDLVNQAGDVGINSIGVTGPEALRIGSGPWTPTTSSAYAVFRITGDQAQVPEPSTLCLIGFGAIALALCTRCRRSPSFGC
jgi:Carboxypeptidase regulatory-like domain/PEP-CTERM motif